MNIFCLKNIEKVELRHINFLQLSTRLVFRFLIRKLNLLIFPLRFELIKLAIAKKTELKKFRYFSMFVDIFYLGDGSIFLSTIFCLKPK